jgi:hypothetical protein
MGLPFSTTWVAGSAALPLPTLRTSILEMGALAVWLLGGHDPSSFGLQ